MIQNRISRLGSVLVAALLGLMLLGPTTVSASTPGWFFTISGGCVTDSVGCPNTPPSPFPAPGPTLNPDIVKVGANAAWSVRITNGGTSNISALYLSTDLSTKSTLSSPTLIGSYDANGVFQSGLAIYGGGASGPAQPCNAAGSGPLDCSFGSLPAGGWVRIDVIAFTVGSPNTNPACVSGSSYYCFNFQAFGNGNTPTDKGGNSHGDTLNGPVAVNTTTSGNYGGGFVLNTNDVFNDGLTKTNLQSETVSPPTSLIAVAIQDGLTSSPVPCAAGYESFCSSGVGDWMRLNVNRGAPFNGGFKIVINVSSKNLPSGTSASDLVLVHVKDDGTAYTLTTTNNLCSASTLPTVAGVECITVTKLGSNFQIVAWLTSNGGLRI